MGSKPVLHCVIQSRVQLNTDHHGIPCNLPPYYNCNLQILTVTLRSTEYLRSYSVSILHLSSVFIPNVNNSSK